MFLKIGVALFFIFIPIIDSHESNVHTIQYTEQNFYEEVPKMNHFIMFYTTWCGDYCEKLALIWEQLAEKWNVEGDDRVRIAKVDCTTNKTLCSDHLVDGYPMFKFFKSGAKYGVRFRGIRILQTFNSYINEQLSNKNNDGPKELTEETFYDTVKEGKHFVIFYTPSCDQCQKLAPTWDEFAINNTTVDISKIDCTNYRKICEEFEVEEYPTLLWIENGKRVDQYDGSNCYEDLSLYVAEKMNPETMEKN